MELIEAFSSFEAVVFWVLFPLLRMLTVLLLALRKRAGWLVLLVEPALSLVLMTASGGFSFASLLLPAVAVYGWWRWRKRTTGGPPPVHSAQRQDWLTAAVFLVLIVVVISIQTLPMMIMYMTGVSAIVQTLVVSALTMLLYFGLARGVVEAWWLGIALSLMGLANAIAAPGSGSAGPGLIWLLEGLTMTVLSGLLYLFGWFRWRAAHTETTVS
jgi:hypothetical protein